MSKGFLVATKDWVQKKIDKINSDKQDKMNISYLNKTITNDGSGNCVIYPFQATEDCVVMFNYRPFSGTGYTEVTVTKVDINNTWIATIHTSYSTTKGLISNSGLTPLSKGEKLCLTLKGGVANDNSNVFGQAVAFKL